MPKEAFKETLAELNKAWEKKRLKPIHLDALFHVWERRKTTFLTEQWDKAHELHPEDEQLKQQIYETLPNYQLIHYSLRDGSDFNKGVGQSLEYLRLLDAHTKRNRRKAVAQLSKLSDMFSQMPNFLRAVGKRRMKSIKLEAGLVRQGLPAFTEKQIIKKAEELAIEQLIPRIFDRLIKMGVVDLYGRKYGHPQSKGIEKVENKNNPELNDLYLISREKQKAVAEFLKQHKYPVSQRPTKLS
ncbi:hypothetical protein HY989_05585 [Candidatus Micrarchaeota archaeon]|nr:hypothetical protein [Candidatus Micrarchaeota archaeon]